MGNIVSVKLSEDTKTLEITEKLVRDLQYHMNLVDRSVTGFARSVDSLRESLAIKKKQENNKKDSNKEAVGEENDAFGSPHDGFILETIDVTLSDQKFVAFESLSKLFSFIIETANSCGISTPDTIFSLDTYRCKSVDVPPENELHYYDARLESMQKKLNAANTAYQTAKDDIENFYTREEIYQKEKLTMTDRISHLEANIMKMKEDIDELIEEKSMLEIRNEDLNREIINLKENDEQMKHELDSEKSSKNKTEETCKDIKDACAQKIETFERERKVRITEIDQKQREIEFLKKNNAEKDERMTLLECQKGCLETKLKENQEQLETLEKIQKDTNDQWLMKYEQLRQENRERESEMNAYKSRTDLIISDRLQEMNKHGELLSTSFSLLHDEVKKKNMEESYVKKLHEAEIRRLTECFEQAKVLEKEYIQAQNVLKEKLERCKEEKKSLEIQICDLQGRNKCLVSNVKESETNLKSTGNQHKEQIDACHTKIQKLKTEKQEQKKINETLINQINSLNKTQAELSSQLSAEKDTNVSLTEEKLTAVNSLQDEICKMNKESIELKQMHEKQEQMFAESLEKEIQKKNKLLQESTDLKKEQERLLEIMKQQNRDKESLTTDIDEKEKLITELKLKVELAAKKEVYLQVMHQSGFHATEAEKELQSMLKVRMVPERINLQFLDCSESFIVKSDLPLLIVGSRNYSYNRNRNISFITKGLKATHKMAALLIFHERDEKAFRREVEHSHYTDSKVRVILDVAYNKNGIYDCGLNAENIENFIQFILESKTESIDTAV